MVMGIGYFVEQQECSEIRSLELHKPMNTIKTAIYHKQKNLTICELHLNF
jgi:hypothetical protein